MGKEKIQPGFMCYWDLLDTILLLPENEIKPMLTAIKKYCVQKEKPNPQGILQYLWPMIQEKLDMDSQRYETIRSQNQVKGLISNFKRNYAPEHGLDPADSQALRMYLESRGIENPEQWTGVDRCPPIQPNSNIILNSITNKNADINTKVNSPAGSFFPEDNQEWL